MDVERPPRILPRLVLWIAGALLVIAAVGWILGAVFALVRTLFLVVIAGAVIWAVVASRSDDR